MDTSNSPEVRLTVLIDADNISHQHLAPMMQEIARYGNPTIKRIYGDWTRPNLNGWKSLLLDYAINPVQQFSYTTGKNATDSSLIIDAMDILYSDRSDAFCLVSSDSDFTRLAMRLREAGKTVYGIGEQKTPNAFIAACDRFIYLEILQSAEEMGQDSLHVPHDETLKIEKAKAVVAKSPAKTRVSKAKEKVKEVEKELEAPKEAVIEKEVKEAPARRENKRAIQSIDNRLIHLITQSIRDIEDENGWAYLGEVGALLQKKQPSFDSRNYGFERLTPLIKAIGLYDMDMRESGPGNLKQIYIRVKNDPERLKRNERHF